MFASPTAVIPGQGGAGAEAQAGLCGGAAWLDRHAHVDVVPSFKLCNILNRLQEHVAAENKAALRYFLRYQLGRPSGGAQAMQFRVPSS
jgi:hypothetical protein